MLMLVSYTDTFVIGAPKGGHVVSGTASFTQDGNLTVITAGNRSVINYTGFDIGKNETVQFIQPGAHATVLNRVTTPDPTNIFGRLESNGIVVISNPYGVFFQNGSVVNVGGLVAGAGKISTADFTAGKIHFTDLNGDVRNDGVIAADNQIALMGANVLNTGSLIAAHGVAMMVSGPDVYVGDKNGNIFVQANGKALRAAAAATGPAAASAGGVTNRGTVAAPRVVLGAGDMYSTAIVNSGLLQGRSIAVNAGKNGSATVGGTLDASSAHHTTATGKGGNIDVLGGKVALQGATLDASGGAGGGNVRVGGDLHGGGTLAHANTTTVDAGTTIKADATGATGDGGTVVLWSDTGTMFAGHISALGGSAGGNGGSVEVSSHNTLYYRGLTDLSAPAGTRGTLLLDPDDIVIDTGGADTIPLATGTPPTSTVPFGAQGSGTETIAPGTLETSLSLANVVLDANNNIVFRVGIAPTVLLPLANNLTLDAGHSIYIGDPGTVGTGAATVATLSTAGNITATYNSKDGNGTTATTAPAFGMTTGSAITTTRSVTITDGNLVGATDGATLGAITAPGGITVDNHLATTGSITVNGALETTPTLTDTAGGNISLVAATGLTLTSTVDASGAGAGNGGTVGLSAGTGAFLANATTDTITSNSTGTGSGGNITLGTTGGDLTAMGAISATSIGTGAGAGHGGTVMLTSTTGSVTAGTITANASGPGNATAGSGAAGNVTLSTNGLPTSNALLTVGVINATGSTAGGTVQLASTGTLASGAITTTASNGTGGNVTLTINPGTAISTLTIPDISTGASNATGLATSGNISINNNSTVTGSGITATGTLNTSGTTVAGSPGAKGGDITVKGPGDIDFTQGITANGVGIGAAGAVKLTAGGLLTTNTINAAGAGTGNGGAVTLTFAGDTDAGGATTLGTITTTSASGTGGAVQLTLSAGATTAATLALPSIATGGGGAASGAVTANNNNATTGSNITDSNALTTTGAGTNSAGGAVALTTTNGSINLTNTLTANGTGTGKGGDVTLSATGGDINLGTNALATNGTGSGAGGKVTLTTDGALTTGTISATGAGAGTGGAVQTTSTGATSLGTITTTSAGGAGGNVSLTINSVTGGTTPVMLSLPAISTTGSTGGKITVTNNNTVSGSAITTTGTLNTNGTGMNGVGGDVALTAPTITLSNPITANGTGTGQGGTVTLDATAALNLNSTVSGYALATLATGAGPITFNDGSSVTTSGGGQTYGGAVTLAQTTGTKLTTLADTGSGGITFSSTVDSDSVLTGQSLTLNTTGNEIFNGAIGSVFSLNNLTTDAVPTVGGTAQFNFALPTGTTNAAGVTLTGALVVNDGVNFGVTGGASVTAPSISTGGAQTYQGPATVGATTYLTSGSTLAFNSTVGSTTATAQALTLNTAGTITLGGGVGTGTLNPLASLTTVGGQEVDLNGGGVTTSGGVGQTYSGVVMLGADTTLTGGAAGPVTFASTVDGGYALTISTGGLTRFENNVGSTTNLTSLSSTGAGGVSFTPLTGSGITTLGVTTSAVGGQNYTGAVTLGADLTLTAGANGPVTFGSTVDGSHALTIATGGLTRFENSVGGSTALTSLSVSGAGGVSFTPLTGSGITTLGVTTSGVNGQNYTGPVTLGADTTLTANANGPVTFGSTVDGGHALTISTGGLTLFENNVGGTTALTSLSVSGAGGVSFTPLTGSGITALTVNTSAIGGQNYTGPVTLGADLTLTAGANGPVTFGSTVDGSHALTIATGGLTQFGSDVGGTTILTSLNSTGNGGVTLGGNVTTSGTNGQSYTGPVLLSPATGTATTLTANGSGPITFLSTVGGSAATEALNLVTVGATPTTPGTITFGGAVGPTFAPLASLTTSAGSPVQINGGAVTTSGTQTYGGPITLGSTATTPLTVLTGATLTPGIIINGGGTQSLTLNFTNSVTLENGTTPMAGFITLNNINNLTSSGVGGTTLQGTLVTVGNQNFADAVTLAANTILTSNTGTVSANSVTGGGFDLTVNAAGSTFGPITNGGALIFNDGAGIATFTGNIGAISLSVSGSGGTSFTPLTGSGITTLGVTTSGVNGQNYTGPVTLGADTTLTANANGPVTFGSTVDGSHALTITTGGLTRFENSVGGSTALTSLSVSGAGGVSFTPLTGSGITTLGVTTSAVGGQNYTGPVTLGADLTLTAGANGPVTFGSTVDGSHALTITTGGLTQFGGDVGGTTVLTSLNSTGAGGVKFTNPLTVKTSGLQNYAVKLTLGGVTTLTSTGSTITADSLAGGGFDLTVNATAAANVAASTFGTITNGGNLIFNDGTGLATFKGNIGAISLNSTGGGGVKFSNALAVTTSAAQTYTGTLTLGGITSLTGTTIMADAVTGNTNPLTVTASTSSNFGEIDGAGALIYNGTGSAAFTGPITATSLAVSNGTGVTLSGGTITTSANQRYSEAVTLGADTTLASTGNGNVVFTSTVDGPVARTLTVNTGGITTFGGAVGGGGKPLASLTTDAAGTTQLNGGTVNTTGQQTYNDAVSLGADTTVTSTGSGANGQIKFGSTLNSDATTTPRALTVNTAGTTIFGGLVGATALASVTTDAPGTTQINGGGVTTTGAQMYNDPLSIGANATLKGTTLSFPSFTGNNFDLTLTFNSSVTANGFTGVHNFTSNGTGNTILSGNFSTSGFQDYENAVMLAANTTLTSTGGGAITLDSTVGGPFALSVGTTGTVTFGGPVGTAMVPLTSVATTGPGEVDINGGSIITNGSGQSFAGPVVLGATGATPLTTLTASGVNASIFFGSTVQGKTGTSQALTLSTTGAQTFDGLVGSTTPLSSLTTGTGVTNFDMTVGTALAGVRINGPLTTGGAVTFDEVGSSLTQPSVLTLNNGAQTYGGTVTLLGAVTVLNSASTEPAPGTFHGGGTITFNGDIVSGVPVVAATGTPELDVRAGAGFVEFDAPITTTGDFAPGGASVVFHGAVGPVGAFTVLPNDLNTGIGGVDINGGNISTGGSQVYNLGTVLSANTVLQAGGNVTFLRTLDGSNLLTNTPYSLDIKLTNGGTVAFNGIVGGVVPLESLTTENVGAAVGMTQFNMVLPLAGSGLGGVNVINAVNIGTNADFEAVGLAGGTVPTIRSGVTYRGQVGTGTQTYGGAVTLGLSSVLHQPTVLQDIAAAGDITFNGRINGKADGDAGLSVNSNGDEVFNQLVGDTHTLASLSTDDVSGGTGATRFNMDLTQTGAAAGVRVAGTVNVNDRAVFNATGGLVHPTILSGGAQNYALAATVRQGTVLTIDPALRTTGLPADNGNVIFQSTVDSGATAQALQVNSPGNEIFKGLVGYTSPLASLTTDATGPGMGQTRFLMTRPSGFPGNGLGGVNVTGNLTVNDGVFFQVGNSLGFGIPGSPSVTSGGTQTYAGPATLGDTTTLVSSNGSVAFNSTVDSDSLATPRVLTVSTPVNTFVTFARAVGGVFPLATLDTEGLGTTQINGGSVTTTDGQTYRQAVTLGQDTTLLSTNANSGISFFRSLDGSHDLTVTASNASFTAVGTTSPLLNLTVNAPSGVNFNYAAGPTPDSGSVNLAGRLTVNGPAIFRAVNAGNVVFVRTGVTVPSYNLASGQDYLDSVLLQGSATFTDLKSGPISFRQTVDGFATGSPSDLTVSTGGTISFLGNVGGATPLTSLTTSNLGVASGQTIISGGGVTTMVDTGPAHGTGAQIYNDAVVLGAGTTLTSLPGTATTGGDIVFASTVNSNSAATPQALTINTSGRTVFGGAVGATNALASLTTDNEGPQDLGTFLNGGSVATTGAQTYNDGVAIGAATTLTSTAGGKIAFVSTLDSNGATTPQALTVNTSGRTVFGGTVGATNALASLTTDNEGPQDLGTFLNGGSVTTTGAQTYNDAVTLGAATTLTSTAGGDVAFNSTLNSNTTGAPQTLVVNTSGRTVFGGAVGATNALASLTTDNEGPQDLGTFLNSGSVTTTSAQTYNDAVTLGANAVLSSSANGTLVFNNTVNGAFALTLNTGGLTIFNRAVGGVTPLTGLTTDNAGAAGEGTQFNMIVGNNAAGVVVNGPVTINDAVLFNVQGSRLTQPGVLTLGNDFSQTYNGPTTLGTSTFLVSASALPVAGGAFTGGGSIRFNSPQGIVANGGTDLTVRAGVGADTLASAVNVGALDLGGASVTFLGPITLPGTLSVEPNDATGGGSVVFTGSALTTTGAQIYNAAFVLGRDTTLTSTGGGTITFNSTVNGPYALTLNTASNEVFNGRVGSITPLASLTTDDPAANIAGGHVVFNVADSTTAAPSVTTTGFQTYHDAATLRADTVLASTGGGTITFGSTVDSDTTATPRALTLNTASDEVFNGQVGGTAALASLTTDDPAANTTAGRTIFNLTGTLPTTPTVTTTGAQTYNDALLVQTGTTLTSIGGGALTFAAAVDGPASLTLDTAGTTTFRGTVGSSITLASLTTQGGGAVTLDGRTVTTTGLQTYGGAVTLGVDTVLTSTATGGGIFFATTVDSDARTTSRTLTLNAVGDETFNGRVGSIAPLASLTTDDPAAGISGGRVIFHIGGTPDAPSVTTTGAQTYNDAALLTAGTVLASTGGGTLTFASTVDGPFALTLNTAGNEVFGGNVGNTQALASLTTDANSVGGQVIFGLPGASAALSVTTVGAQTYNDAALLQTGTTLNSTGGGTLTFASTVDGPFALSLDSAGDEIFDGQIGHNAALASLSTDADTKNAGGNVRFFFAGTDASPSVTTTGAQAYHDPAVLHADTVLASTGSERLAFLSTVDNNSTANPHTLTLNTSGDELFGGLIGAAKAIGNLTTDSSGAAGGQAQFAMDVTGKAAGVNVNGTVTVNDAVFFNAPGVTANNVLIQSTGAQSYNGPATLGADAVLASSGGGALLFNSTVVGPRNLTLNTGGTTIFNGAIGSGTGDALASLTTQGGPVVLNAGTVNTTGAQVYSGAVTLAQNTVLTSTADGINFGSTVDGGVALTLATAGATTFGGAVGGNTPLTTLTAADGSGVIINGGLVVTRGLQTYGGTLTINGPDEGSTILKASNDETSADVTQHGNIVFKQDVTVNGGSLLVQGRRILAEANADISVAGAGNLDLEADDVLILQGANYGSVSGNVILNDPQGGLIPNSANRATIFLTNTRTVFHGGNFDMGYLQNMFSQGSVSITVGGTATLSDIAANGTLNVSAGSILLRARDADASRGSASGGADDGLNFVARTSINFGNTTIRYDNTHSNNDVANFVTTTGQVTVNRDQSQGISLFQDPTLAVLFQQTTVGLNDNNFGSFNNLPFQPISGGTQTIDTAAALSGALPDQKPLDVAVDITVTAGQLEELKKLGIHPRRAARQEKLSLSSKRALFAQLVDGQDQDNYGLLQPIKGGISRLVPSDYVVVVDRMSEREVQSILTAFEELYGKNKEKAAPIGESFNTAFTDYTTEKQTGDPAGFAPYLVEKPGKYPDVDKAVRGFDNLFGYIESLGLTSKEQAKSKEHIASDLQVAGVSPEDMVKVIDTLRAKIPKNQKAPSTKLPPSPPATAPAPGATNPPPPAQKAATPPLKTARQPGQEPTRKTVRRAQPVEENRLHEVAGL